MSKVRPPYPVQFRQQMVELVRAGCSSAQLSREFGVTAQSITNWVNQAAIDDGKPLPDKDGLTTAEREELVRLRRQLRQVQMERCILAKATAWFAGLSDATSTKSSDSGWRTKPTSLHVPCVASSVS
ncbi:transposase [Acidovorax sp. CCYZU-2555]|nr:transposase [Acidovorax sp. CCYZU-2555]